MSYFDERGLRYVKAHCHKVLPLVYDQSLSYYEVLCKLTYNINKVLEDIEVPIDPTNISYKGEWNERTDYTPYDLVYTDDGNIYISLQDVYAGTELTDTGYWLKVVDNKAITDSLTSLDTRVTDMGGSIVLIGQSITALQEAVRDIQGELDNLDIELDYTTPEKHGAVGDGVTDDRQAIQDAIDSGKPVLFKQNTIYAISVKNNTRALELKTGTVLNLNGATIKLIPNGYVSYSLLHLENISNVEIFDGTIYGDKEVNVTSNEWCYGIFGRGCSNIYIHDMVVKYSSGDGIEFGDLLCQNIHIDNVLCDHNGRNGLSITRGNGIFITNSTFSNTSGHNPQEGIDIEANNASDTLKDIHISNCSCVGNVHAGINITSLADSDSIFVDGCNLDCAIMATVRGSKSYVQITRCQIRAYHFVDYGANWSYGVGSGIYAGCADTSNILIDGIIVDCTNYPAYVFTYSEGVVVPGRYNITAKNIRAINGMVDRWILNRGSAPHNCFIEIDGSGITPLSSSGDFITLVAGETNYTVTIRGRYEFSQASGGTISAYGDELIATQTAGNNLTILKMPPNAPVRLYNNGTVLFGIVGPTFYGPDGNSTSRVTIDVGQGVEFVNNPITGNYSYKYI